VNSTANNQQHFQQIPILQFPLGTPDQDAPLSVKDKTALMVQIGASFSTTQTPLMSPLSQHPFKREPTVLMQD
jgi:hypothetical protein